MNKDLLINKEKTIKEAMDILGKVNPKILFVVDGKKLIGTLTDGDVRRHLLAKGTIEDFVSKACNNNPIVVNTLEEAKERCNDEFIAIPIIKGNKLIDIYSKRSEIEKETINIPVAINAGGMGTRLRSLSTLPKPLIPIGDYPIVGLIMNEFKSQGCANFSLIVNYKKELIKSYFKKSKDYKIKFYDEDIPLGTGGGLKLLDNKINETFFFSNCDTLIKSNYKEIYDYHKRNNNAITAVCVKKAMRIPYGVIETNKDLTIRKFTEKPNVEYITNTGLYVVEPSVLKDLEENESIDFPSIIEREKNKGNRVSVYLINENDWYDMGQVTTFEDTKRRLVKV